MRRWGLLMTAVAASMAAGALPVAVDRGWRVEPDGFPSPSRGAARASQPRGLTDVAIVSQKLCAPGRPIAG
jgi:hypothetical protein